MFDLRFPMLNLALLDLHVVLKSQLKLPNLDFPCVISLVCVHYERHRISDNSEYQSNCVAPENANAIFDN